MTRHWEWSDLISLGTFSLLYPLMSFANSASSSCSSQKDSIFQETAARGTGCERACEKLLLCFKGPRKWPQGELPITATSLHLVFWKEGQRLGPLKIPTAGIRVLALPQKSDLPIPPTRLTLGRLPAAPCCRGKGAGTPFRSLNTGP